MTYTSHKEAKNAPLLDDGSGVYPLLAGRAILYPLLGLNSMRKQALPFPVETTDEYGRIPRYVYSCPPPGQKSVKIQWYESDAPRSAFGDSSDTPRDIRGASANSSGPGLAIRANAVSDKTPIGNNLSTRSP